MAEKFTVTERLGRTSDGRIVPYEHVDAAFLAYQPGEEIPLAEAEAAGLVKRTPEVKEAAPPEDKMVEAPENKAAKMPKKRARKKG